MLTFGLLNDVICHCCCNAVVCKYFSLKNKAKHSVELMWQPDTHAVAGCENVVISTFLEEALATVNSYTFN